MSSERCETARSLSTVDEVGCEDLPVVREDPGERTSSVPVVTPVASLGSYVRIG